MRILVISTVIISAALSAGAYAASGKGIAPGVYECFGVGVSSGPTIGILDGSSYKSRNGQVGRYTFEKLELTLVSGPLAGVRYRMEQPYGNLRVLKGNDVTTLNCPKNATKDPNKPPW